MNNTTFNFIKQYLINNKLDGFQASLTNNQATVTVLDNKQIKPISAALKELVTRYGFIVNNPIKSINIKAEPDKEPTYNAYGNKVKATYSSEQVRADFESTTSTNLNRKVFVISIDPELDNPSVELPSVCSVDPSFCLLSLHELHTKDKLNLVEEFPECQKCYDLTT